MGEAVDIEAARAAAAMPAVLRADAPLRPALIQEMWWGWTQGHPEQLPHEKLHLFMRFEGVDAEAAETAVRAIVARHKVLRQRFWMEAGELKTALNEASDFGVERTRLPEGIASEAGFDAGRAAFQAPPLPIDGPWLSRARVIDGGAAGIAVAMSFHHMVFDARSRWLVERALDAALAGGEDPWGERPVGQYTEFAAWERGWLDGPARPLIALWQERLGRLPSLGNPKGGVLRWRPGHKAYYDLTLAGDRVRRIRGFAGEAKASSFRVVLAVLAASLARWSGQGRFAIRVVGDVRTGRDLPEMIGNLVATDIVELWVPERPDMAALVRSAGAAYVAAAGLRLPNLLGLPGAEAFPDPSATGVGGKAAVTLNYLPIHRLKGARPQAPPPAPEAEPRPVRLAQREYWPTPVCPINLRIWDWGSHLVFRLEFDDDAIAEADQHRFIALFVQTVQTLPVRPG